MLSPCCLMHADDVMQSKVHPLHLATGELGEALGGKWGGRALEGVRGIIRGSTMLLWHMQHYAPYAAMQQHARNVWNGMSHSMHRPHGPLGSCTPRGAACQAPQPTQHTQRGDATMRLLSFPTLACGLSLLLPRAGCQVLYAQLWLPVAVVLSVDAMQAPQRGLGIWASVRVRVTFLWVACGHGRCSLHAA